MYTIITYNVIKIIYIIQRILNTLNLETFVRNQNDLNFSK